MPSSVPATATPAYPPASYIDPAALMQIRSLELRAKAVVEGFFSGLHRSPYHGFSVEFTEYRQYVPGDDPRYLDWRLYARSDRFYVKRFEDETNLRCHLILDTSKSMTFGSLGYTKADYAKTLCATLGYFLNTQRDAVGLVRFDEADRGVHSGTLPRSDISGRLMLALERPAVGEATDLGNAARPGRRAGSQTRHAGADLRPARAAGSNSKPNSPTFRARGHEVVLFQTLDPAEMTLGFEEATTLFYDVGVGPGDLRRPGSGAQAIRRAADGAPRRCAGHL